MVSIDSNNLHFSCNAVSVDILYLQIGTGAQSSYLKLHPVASALQPDGCIVVVDGVSDIALANEFFDVTLARREGVPVSLPNAPPTVSSDASGVTV